MFKTTQIRLAAGLAAVVVIGSGYAEQGPQYRSMLVNSMGRSGTASVSGPGALYLNPAGLAGLQGYGVEATGDVGINSQLLDYANWASKNHSKFNNFDSLLVYMDPSLNNKWATYAESYALQGHYNDYAISVVRDVHYDLTLGQAVLVPDIGAGMVSDLQVVVGRGFTPLPDWNFGVSAKYLYRQEFPDKLLGPNDDQYYTVKGCWQGPSSSLIEKRDVVTCASKYAQDEYGFGLNMGVNHPLPMGFSVGASLLDLPTFFNGGFMYPEANVGASYAKNFAGFTGLSETFRGLEAVSYGLLVNLDWQLPFEYPVTPWFKQWKTGVALEGNVHHHEVGLLSAGLNDGYPSFGVRAGYILYAYYLYTAQENGDYPGQSKVSYHRIGLDLNF